MTPDRNTAGAMPARTREGDVSQESPGAAASPRREWEPVIGLEIHVQLATRSKLFCGSPVEFGAPPNTHVCPVCLGLPGALPVTNAQAVSLAVRAALGLGCTVHETSIFARKNYFYPDLPKGYQITQFDRPLASGGWVEAPGQVEPPAEVEARETQSRPEDEGERAGRRDSGMAAEASRQSEDARPGPARPPALSPSAVPGVDAGAADPLSAPPGRIRIRRIHLEEDAGKSLHDRFEGKTAIDLNRAGVPLIEIVTEPDLRSPAQARTFLTRLKQTLEYLEVSDCDMEKGSLRVDANVSVRPRGSAALGTKTEVKNMNSFSNVERALAFEIRRQVRELEGGGAIGQDTLLWDAARGEARAMRSKEESHDYRYFPEPDLPPLVLSAERIDAIRRELPELPAARLRRLMGECGLSPYDADVLTATRAIADYFERAAAAAASAGTPAKAAANWVMSDVLGWANRRQLSIRDVPVTPEQLGELLGLVSAGTLSHNMARQVFERAADGGRSPAEIVASEGLAQVRDEQQLDRWVADVLAAHPAEAERYRAGEARLLGFLMGELMKASRGAADPARARDLLRQQLESGS